jgi:hypothetical protein
MTIHLTAFALFLVACVINMVLIYTSAEIKKEIDVTIAAIVLESIGGLILLRIFKKICIVVKERAKINA